MKNTNIYLILIVFVMSALNIVRAQKELEANETFTEHYFYQNGEKVSYPSHPNELLVIIKSNEAIVTGKDISEFEDSIKSQGLVIYKTFLEPPTDPTQIMKYNSYNPLIRKKIIVKKKDGSGFKRESSIKLAILRKLEKVEFAGPLIMMDDNYYDAYTYDHYIRLEYPLKNIDGATLNKLLKAIDERYFFDEKNYGIVLPPETNENVPQIMEKIYESGISETLYMSVMKFKRKQSNINPKTITSQLNSFDTLEHDSLIYGGEEPTYNSHFKTANVDYYTRGNQKIAFQKKINFIGVAFKNEMSKESVLKLIKDWELTVDAVYMNGLFFVLKFPVDLSSDSIETIRESIILSKEVTIIGDILIQTENNLVLATQDLIVKWKPEASEAVKQAFIKQYGLTEIRKVSYITGGFQYRIEPYVAYASTDICLKLLEAGIVEFAEPDIISTSEDD